LTARKHSGIISLALNRELLRGAQMQKHPMYLNN